MRIGGELVTERFEYDGGREVTVYEPAAPPEAVVFAGDRQLVPGWREALDGADGPPTMIVGAPSEAAVSRARRLMSSMAEEIQRRVRESEDGGDGGRHGR